MITVKDIKISKTVSLGKIHLLTVRKDSSLALSLDVLPSICYYTVMNATSSICVVEVSDDSSMAAIGFSNSNVKVWSLSPYKLKALKPSDSLVILLAITASRSLAGLGEP